MSAIEFSEHLSALIAESGLSKKEIAVRAGISRTNLYNILNGQVSEAKLSTLISLSSAVGVHPLDLIRIYFKGLGARRSAVSQKGLATGFVRDVSCPDYSVVYTGEVFAKVWAVTNTGTQTWVDLFLQCQDQPIEVNGHRVGLEPIESTVPIPVVEPGETAEIEVVLKAPLLPCTVKSEWKSVDHHGNLLFPEKAPLYCLVKVADTSV